jgi:hypothetical protein
MKKQNKRNAYAEIASARKNAGPMQHKDPPREKVIPYTCLLCDEVLWIEGELCDSCWEKIIQEEE